MENEGEEPYKNVIETEVSPGCYSNDNSWRQITLRDYSLPQGTVMPASNLIYKL